MFGRYGGLMTHLKQNVPRILAIDCVIDRQHLTAFSIKHYHSKLNLK